MKIERVFVLRFEGSKRIPYGVPEFLSEEEASDFLSHVQSELSEGAAQYFATCCTQRLPADSDDADDGDAADREKVLTFSRNPSARVRRLGIIASRLRVMGLNIFAVKARNAEMDVVGQQVQRGGQEWPPDEPEPPQKRRERQR
ncbi:MAG: hypothetical protein M3Y55_00805 [Pseudomonadota bacterium]|nr:hypothetical protein [Pseudomonadota bacterium]MDQ2764299.1 hypothetical protein [Pseudomonadota bacterium]